MRRHRTRTRPAPGQLWLGCPPYVLVARVIDVDERRSPTIVHYELHDEYGSPLEQVSAALDDGWWQAFQPLVRRDG